jgi:hypothetical protein
MAAYSRFLGVAVKVQYRLGDIQLSASGTFVADSGRSIFLEQNVEQRGKLNQLRWEIPYAYLTRIEGAEETQEPATSSSERASNSESAATREETAGPEYNVAPLTPLHPRRT